MSVKALDKNARGCALCIAHCADGAARVRDVCGGCARGAGVFIAKTTRSCRCCYEEQGGGGVRRRRRRRSA
jgi:hypothetical protein